MLTELSIEQKQQLLLASRIRFGPDFEVPREAAIDAIVERSIFAVENSDNDWVRAEKIDKYLHEKAQIKLHSKEVKSAIQRLIDRSAVQTGFDKDKKLGYRLADENRESLHTELNGSLELTNDVVRRLFEPLIGGPEDLDGLRSYFLAFLCKVFAKFGTQWVLLQTGNIKREQFLDSAAFDSIIAASLKGTTFDSDQKKFVRRKSYDFFRLSETQFDRLKFNLGQSYYIAEILGMKSDIDLLSKSVFAGAELWLDTNVVIIALLPGSRHHRTFHRFRELCSKLGISMNVSRRTASEIVGVIEREKRLIAELYDDIPEEYFDGHKSSDQFLESYRLLKQESKGIITCDDLFQRFYQIEDELKKYQIDLIDVDPSRIEKCSNDPAVQRVLQEQSLRIRRVKKGNEALEHDSFHYCLVKDRRKYGKKVWFLSLDTSLPTVSGALSSKEPLSFSILLDTFLQSISPFITSSESEDDFARTFSEMIASQVLPQNQLFDLRDFMVFQEVGISCRDMSVDEIDDVFHKVKAEILKGTNPHQMSEKQKRELNYWFQKYTADHKKRTDSLLGEKERRIENLSSELGKVKTQMLQDREGHLQVVNGLNTQMEDMRREHSRDKKELANRITTLESERKEDRHLALSVLIVVASMVAAVFAAKYAVEHWNGYMFYVPGAVWLAYPFAFGLDLLIIGLLFGKQVALRVSGLVRFLSHKDGPEERHQ